MRHIVAVLAASLSVGSVLHPAVAQANFSCAGAITYLGSDADGRVWVDVGQGKWTICNLSETYNGVTTPQVCQGWYSALMSAKLSAKSVLLYFDPSNAANDGITSCEGLGNWSARAPYHLALL